MLALAWLTKLAVAGEQQQQQVVSAHEFPLLTLLVPDSCGQTGLSHVSISLPHLAHYSSNSLTSQGNIQV